MRAARPTGIVERLRADTRADHDAIEATLDWRAQASDRARYRAWLERLYGFHRAWEPAVAETLADPSFFEPRRKLDLLADDLGRLGMPESSLDRLPGLAAPLRFGCEAEALGSMYVLEGSTLGGKLIAKEVLATTGHSPRYHDAYGNNAGAMWRAFQARLRAAVPPEKETVAVDAATATFALLRSWLRPPASDTPR